MEAYKMAATLTPASISRLQNLAMMTYYSGDHVEAEKLLDRTARMGLESKMFDCQSLVLLAFVRLESGDRKGLQRCHDDFARLIERNPDNARQRRLSEIVIALNLIQQHQFAQSVEAIRGMITMTDKPEFDFESASNLLSLLALLANKAIQLDEVDSAIQRLGNRFCSNRSLTELLVASAKAHPPYAEQMRACQASILEIAETAMALSMAGDPGAAVKNLLLHTGDTLNARLVDNAYQLLLKNGAKIKDATELTAKALELRARCGTTNVKASLGEQKRQAGGLALRTGTKTA
jgi:tetratricopeptide (TPR) repeat protein